MSRRARASARNVYVVLYEVGGFKRPCPVLKYFIYPNSAECKNSLPFDKYYLFYLPSLRIKLSKRLLIFPDIHHYRWKNFST
jgi:hypothetical protein